MPDTALLPNFFGGYDQAAAGARALDVMNPATGARLAGIPDSGPETVKLAVEAAAEKGAWWSARTPGQRSLVLLSLASAIEQRAGEFAYTLSRDQGLPLALAREFEVPAAVRNLRYWGTRILHGKGEARTEPGGPLAYTHAKPLGVAGLLLPSTRGLSTLTLLAGAALAAGNTVVAKPSAKAPLAARLLADLLNEAGVPPGVLNIVFGSGPLTGRAILEDPGVKMLAFAGSPSLSRELGAAAAARGIRFAGEEGGRQVTIITAEADLAEAAIAGLRGAFSPLNEAALDASLFLVEEKVFDAFAEKLARTASLLRVGDPEERDTQVGPLPSARARDAFARYLRENEARLLQGGNRPSLPPPLHNGYYVEPALLRLREPGELLPPPPGPLACLAPFENRASLLRLVASTPGFQAASLWTKDLHGAHSLARALPVESVTINAWSLSDPADPFSGAKRSGLAQPDILAAFTREQTIRIKL